MDELPTETTWWSWAVKGLGGIINIIDVMSVNGPRITEGYHIELTRAVAQLARVVGRLDNRRIDKGVEHARPDRTITDDRHTYDWPDE